MTDNFTWEESSSGIEFASDDVSGVHYQKVKLAVGEDDEAANWDGSVLVNDGTVNVAGWSDHDTPVTGEPVLLGAYAQDDGAPTAVSADGDAVNLIADLQGRLWARVYLEEIGDILETIQESAGVASGVYNETMLKKTVDFTASQTAQTIWTPTSGKKFVVVQAIVSFSAGGTLTVFDGTDTTTNRIFQLHEAANGGMAWTAAIPVLSSTSDNVLKYTTGAGAAGSITVFGYEVG